MVLFVVLSTINSLVIFDSVKYKNNSSSFGFLVIKAAVLKHLPLPIGGFFPEPWLTLTPQLRVSQITLSTA